MKWLSVGWLAPWGRVLRSFAGAVTFYTCIPVPAHWVLEFRGIARWAPVVGVLLGGILGGIDAGLQSWGVPIATRSAVVVVLWIALTGGLHLDGVIDTADGLAVQDPKRRLDVMADSVAGAFGAMAAAAVLLLKTVALTDLEVERGLALVLAAGWGRWGQVVAIAFYPYLKPTGKGAFLKATIRTPHDLLLGMPLLLGLGSLPLLLSGDGWVPCQIAAGGGAIAVLTGAFFHRQLGGHTGDTYGAVVEWTEALFLCYLTSIFRDKLLPLIIHHWVAVKN